MKVDTIVIGDVVTEQAVLHNGCIAVAEGKVLAVSSDERHFQADERLEFRGNLVLPGVIDAHVHSRGEPTEGFTNSTRAAASGGVTTILDMPSDQHKAVVSVEYFKEKAAYGEAECLVDFGLWAGATNDNLEFFSDLSAAGVIGFKVYMSQSQRLGHIDDGQLLETFREAARLNRIVAVHAENFGITTYLIKKYRDAGRCEPDAFLAARPDLAETEAVMRAVTFARACGTEAHFVHISLAASAKYIHEQRIDYPHLSVETCPQYLLLSSESLNEVGAYAKVAPPLRKRGEPDAMWAEVQRGSIDMISTDHAPHVQADKTRPCIFDNASGMPGVETLLPLMYSEGVVKRGIPIGRMASLLSANPARRFGIYPRKGALLAGSDADLVVVDPSVRWQVQAKELHQASGWTAFEGMHVQGKPILTMVRGSVVSRNGEIVGSPGFGRLVRPTQSSPARNADASN